MLSIGPVPAALRYPVGDAHDSPFATATNRICSHLDNTSSISSADPPF